MLICTCVSRPSNMFFNILNSLGNPAERTAPSKAILSGIVPISTPLRSDPPSRIHTHRTSPPIRQADTYKSSSART